MAETFQGGSRARKLFDQGMSCNAIARELGVGAATISRWAKREGLSFDRGQVATANQARAADAKARRLSITERLYARAERNLSRLEATSYRYRVTYADGSETVTDNDPPAADELRHSQAISNYLKSAAQLEAVDSSAGAEDAKSMLAQLGRALGIGQPVDNSPIADA